MTKLRAVEYKEDNVLIAGHIVPFSEGVRKALHDLSQVEVGDSELP
jgi:hypothetical protein